MTLGHCQLTWAWPFPTEGVPHSVPPYVKWRHGNRARQVLPETSHPTACTRLTAFTTSITFKLGRPDPALVSPVFGIQTIASDTHTLTLKGRAPWMTHSVIPRHHSDIQISLPKSLFTLCPSHNIHGQRWAGAKERIRLPFATPLCPCPLPVQNKPSQPRNT